MHFHFLSQVGSCHVNGFDKFKKEMRIVKFSVCHVTLSSIFDALKACSQISSASSLYVHTYV